MSWAMKAQNNELKDRKQELRKRLYDVEDQISNSGAQVENLKW